MASLIEFRNSRRALRSALFVAVVISTGSFSLGGQAAERVAAPSTSLPPLPEAVASFGAVVSKNWLYVYSGHIGEAHAHSIKNLSQKFQRLPLRSTGGWEMLPVGPGLQSVALVAYRDNVYRVGGLSAHNEPDEEEKLVSVRDFTRFDPQTKQWTALEPLPEGRSSHDAVVVGDKLYVVGGWNLGSEHDWHKYALMLDLSQADVKWSRLPEQPFQRRALAVAEVNGRIYAIGGMNADDKPSTDVHYFDIAKNVWSTAPSLPGKGMSGFGCSAVGVDGKLYATTIEGGVYRLNTDGTAWDLLGKLQEPRFFHRLLSEDERSLLIVGGASRTKGHLDSLERFLLPADQR